MGKEVQLRWMDVLTCTDKRRHHKLPIFGADYLAVGRLLSVPKSRKVPFSVVLSAFEGADGAHRWSSWKLAFTTTIK